MSVHDDRAQICAAIKTGATPCPAGESLTTIRQRWTAQQCAEYMRSHGLTDTTDIERAAEVVTPIKIHTPESEIMRDIQTTGAGAMLEQAIKMLAAGSIDAEAVRRIVREETAGTARTVAVVVNDRPAVDVGLTHEKFEQLLRVVSAGVKNVMLVGPSAAGKTHAAKQLAQALGVTYYSQGACILPSDLMGYKDAASVYQSTQFVEAMTHGGVCILDEMDSYSERALLAANEALSNGSFVAGGRRIDRHPDCVIIAGANTYGLGSTLEFTGRARLDAATLSRFPVKINFGIDKKMEAALSGNPALSAKIQQYREKCEMLGMKVQITPRHTIAAAQLVAGGVSEADAFNMTVFAGLTPDQIRKIQG